MPDYEKTKMVIGDVWHIVMLVLLLGVALGALTWTGMIRCQQIPGWCGIYDPIYLSMSGKREILIVHGDDGIGDYLELQKRLRDPKIIGVQADLEHISRIGQGNLQNYDLVIVEHARTMSTKQMQYFIDFADSGGKLVWTGDAGTVLAPEDSMLFEDDLDENAGHVALSPWARRQGSNTVRLDLLISAEYLGNYCENSECGRQVPVGKMMAESTGEHQLIYGLGADQELYVSSTEPKADFAIVSEPESIGSKRVLTLDYGTVMKTKDGKELGRYFPLIVTSGIGEKVAYYAQPPEMFLGTIIDYENGYKRTIGPTSLFIANLYKFYRK